MSIPTLSKFEGNLFGEYNYLHLVSAHKQLQTNCSRHQAGGGQSLLGPDAAATAELGPDPQRPRAASLPSQPLPTMGSGIVNCKDHSGKAHALYNHKTDFSPNSSLQAGRLPGWSP